jgi:hypothetical protein
MREEVTRQAAQEIVCNCDKGVLIMMDVEPVPTIGEVEEQEYQVNVASVEFGGLPDGVDVEI